MNSIISGIRFLNKAIYDDSDRPNRIVQMNGSHALYSVIVIEKFKVKIVYAIYPMFYYTSRHYGMNVCINEFLSDNSGAFWFELGLVTFLFF